jgi:hypothetical protein
MASSKIYVGNLSWNTTDDILHQAFSAYGTVLDCTVMKDRETGRSRGFGFVYYGSLAEADAAIASMNESELDGRRVRVTMAGPTAAGPNAAGYTGGYGRAQRVYVPGGPGGGGRYRSSYGDGQDAYVGSEYGTGYGDGSRTGTYHNEELDSKIPPLAVTLDSILEDDQFESQGSQSEVSGFNRRAKGDTSDGRILNNLALEHLALTKKEQRKFDTDRNRYVLNPGHAVQAFNNEAQLTQETSTVLEDAPSEASSSNDKDSIFSTESRASLTSAATEWSKNTGYTTTDMEIATSNLLSMLEEDEVLVPFYKAAIQSASIGPQRFENKFRRLLRSYSANLKEEAHDSLEHLASRLVVFKARFLSKSIVDKYMGPISKTIETKSEHQEDASDEENEDDASYESVFEDLTKVREFWHESNAFEILCKDLGKFVAKSDVTMKVPSPPSVAESSVITPMAQNDRLGHHGIADVFSSLYNVFLLTGIMIREGPPRLERIEWRCVSIARLH